MKRHYPYRHSEIYHYRGIDSRPGSNINLAWNDVQHDAKLANDAAKRKRGEIPYIDPNQRNG